MKNSGKQLVGILVILVLLAIILVIFFVNGSNGSSKFSVFINKSGLVGKAIVNTNECPKTFNMDPYFKYNLKLTNKMNRKIHVLSIINQKSNCGLKDNWDGSQKFVTVNLWSADGKPYYFSYYGGSTAFYIGDVPVTLKLNATGGRQTKGEFEFLPRDWGQPGRLDTSIRNFGRYVRIWNNDKRSTNGSNATALLLYVDGNSNYIVNNDKASVNRTDSQNGNVLPLTPTTEWVDNTMNFGLITVVVDGKSTVCVQRVLDTNSSMPIINTIKQYLVFDYSPNPRTNLDNPLKTVVNTGVDINIE